jgi:hypothetical protein
MDHFEKVIVPLQDFKPSTDHKRLFAYVSIVSIDSKIDPTGDSARAQVREFFKSARSILSSKTEEDIVLLIQGGGDLTEKEADYAKSINIKVHKLPVRVIGTFSSPKLHLTGPGENLTLPSALYFFNKLRSIYLIEYKRILFFQIGLLFHHNCDSLFDSDSEYDFVAQNAHIGGPINPTMFIAKTNRQAFYDMQDAYHTSHFTQSRGWLEAGPIQHVWQQEKHGPVKTDWSFERASQDIGILYYYYFMSPLAVNGQVKGKLLPAGHWSKSINMFKNGR